LSEGSYPSRYLTSLCEETIDCILPDHPDSLLPGTNKQSIAAIQLRNRAGVTASGMGLSLSKSLPSLGHLNKKGFFAEDQRLCVRLAGTAQRIAGSLLQPTCFIPLTNERSDFCLMTPRLKGQDAIRAGQQPCASFRHPKGQLHEAKPPQSVKIPCNL
jgi:hypothetical protein